MFDNRILLLCEGPNEEKILNILLDNDCLKFCREDLIERRPFPLLNKLKTPSIRSTIKNNGEMIDIVRVKDSQQDNIKIPPEIRKYVSKDRVYDYCTKPSIEMLLIINEKLFGEYRKISSKIDPKNFAKQRIVYNGVRYDNSTKFYESYYGGDIDKLIKNIKEYKTKKNHENNERYLADLLK